MLAAPPSFFTIPLGLAGLAGAWHTVATFYGVSAAVGDGLYALTALVYLLLIGAVVARLVTRAYMMRDAITNPMVSPFYSALPITGMLLAVGLEPHAHPVAQGLYVVCLVATAVYGAWLTGQWIAAPLEQNDIHPGYFLPTVAGGLIGGQGAAAFGFTGLGWMSFGVGILCWMLLGSLILNRLFLGASLPTAQVPSLAIELVPPAVAGNAYAALTGGRIDAFAYALAGYTVLMVLVQVRLVPLYRALPFAPSFWGFTFSSAAVAVNALRWIHVEQPGGARLLAYAVLALITLFIGGIALRSIWALKEGSFLPVPTT